MTEFPAIYYGPYRTTTVDMKVKKLNPRSKSEITYV